MTPSQHLSVAQIVLECDTSLFQLVWNLVKDEAKLSLVQAGVETFYGAIVYQMAV